MQNDYLFIIYPLFFMWLFYRIPDKKSNINYTILLAIFVLSTINAFFTRHNYDIYHVENISPDLFAIVFHCMTLWALLYPFRRFDEFRKCKIVNYQDFFTRILLFIVISCCIFTIYTDIPKINFALLLNDSKELRYLLIDESMHSSNTYIYTINRLGSVFGPCAIGAMFYTIRNYPQKKLLIALLFISGLTNIISGLAVAAREYFLKYAFICVLFYMLDKDYLSAAWKKKIMKVGVTFGSIFLFVFTTITILRFTGSDNYSNPIGSIFSYFSQGFLYFSAFFKEFPDGIAGGSMSFPFFTGESFSRMETNSLVESNLKLNNFSTTIGSWIVDGGVVFTLFAVFIYNRLFVLIRKQPLSIFTYFYLAWAFEFIFSSLFFFNTVMDLQRVFALFLVIILNIISKKQNVKL